MNNRDYRKQRTGCADNTKNGVFRRILAFILSFCMFYTSILPVAAIAPEETGEGEAESEVYTEETETQASEEELLPVEAENRMEEAPAVIQKTEEPEPAAEDPAPQTWESQPQAEEPEPQIEELPGEPEPVVVYEGGTLEATGGAYSVSLCYGPEARIPQDAWLSVRLLEAGTPEYEDYVEQIRKTLGENVSVTDAVLFDISIMDGDTELQPEAPVDVQIRMIPVEVNLAEEVKAIHFAAESEGDETAPIEIEDLAVEGDAGTVESVSFTTDGFSIYAIVCTIIETEVTTSDGSTYEITVRFESNTGIPQTAHVEAEEITPDSPRYEDYIAKTAEELGTEPEAFSYAKFLNISIMDGETEVQPAEGTAVSVAIRLMDRQAEGMPSLFHFGTECEQTEFVLEEDTLTFEASGFSVYAIVDAPQPVPETGWTLVESLDELTSLASEGFYIRNPGGYYFTSGMYTVSGTRTGIKKTKPASDTPDPDSGALYYAEPVSETEFRFWCYDIDGGKTYVRQSANSLSLVSEADASVFLMSEFPGSEKTFRALGANGYYWNMQGGANGNGFAAYNNATDTNARIQFMYYTYQEKDPYGLDGTTYGIAYQDNSVIAAALTTEISTASQTEARLKGKDLVMKPDVIRNDGVMLVAEDSDITEWTFTSVREDKYWITTVVDGVTKYLTFDGKNISLQDSPDEENSLIQARPGTGQYEGKWHFTVNNLSLNFCGSANNGFNAASGSGASTWMNLVKKSSFSEDDFTLYNARKVSVSDTVNVYDGAQIVLYTRIWNDSTKQYEFYAVDHDGSLMRAYDTGDNIEWVGSQINTAVWNFREGTNSDGSLSYYYWLQNAQYVHDFIMPKRTGNQTIYTSTEPDGTTDFNASVNLNGRRYGENYTPIIAWDDASYSYSGLRAEKTSEGWKLVPCALAEADDIYFAIMTPVEEEDEVTTVKTIDNSLYGITMRMIDFNNEKTIDGSNVRDSIQNAFFGGDNNNPGLLTTDLGADGYPVTTEVTGNADHSLGELFNNMSDVNHLLIESIYNESGYFEYDSTSNFAHLVADEDDPWVAEGYSVGDFVIYDQVGAINDYKTNTGMHGQFMPYDDLTPGKHCSFTNQTSVLATELSDFDPRKGETLYDIGSKYTVDYYFGMEMSASFTQTADGLDAWGHDIIFEFSGDDDFWFYVDGELVLDLGGVHSAMTGSINFRTGEVKSSRGNSTLYELFKKNYQNRGLSEDEIALKLEDIFETKTVAGKTVHVFKDYSSHTMQMFYMERGAGASNLHMRFNLAAVKPGTVELSKKLSGTDSESNSLIEFPYQIYYTKREEAGTIWHLLGSEEGDTALVTYKDSSKLVTYKQEFTPAGGTVPYRHVFMLKPGETAVIDLPDTTLEYKIVECGVDPAVYDEVKANGAVLTGTENETETGNEGRYDYAIDPDNMVNRPQVDYVNHVTEGAMRDLSITKKLYDSDGEKVLHYDAKSGETQDQTLFSFRLYLGTENDAADSLPLANLYTYVVKDRDGRYVRWDTPAQKFMPVETGSGTITEYSALLAYVNTLSDAQREEILFRTSMSGSISRIPSDYTVEVHDLIVGTQWKVEERAREIPKGYTLRLEDGYQRTDTEPWQNTETTPISGIMKVNESPKVLVSNQKGWGLTVEKIWTDKDFMRGHDDIFFAVYLNNELLEGSVRRLSTDETSIYYFFGNLDNEHRFEEYIVREVTLTGSYEVDSEGVVTGYESVTPIEPGETLTIGGTPVGGEYHTGYKYTVAYEQGEQTTQNENVRTDKVTNSRPGIKLIKQDMNGEPLAGAVFTLKEITETGERDMAAPTYTSGSDGWITTAYLPAGEYILRETIAPRGYTVMGEPLYITVDENNTVTITGGNGLCELSEHPEENMLGEIIIKNRTTGFRLEKYDSDTGEPLPGIHFALYAQVKDKDGNWVKANTPLPGYDDLVTNDDGVLEEISMALGYGTYYLVETNTLDYEPISEDLCFTIGTDGTVAVNNEAYKSWLTIQEEEGTRAVTYLIQVPNSKGFELPKTGGGGVIGITITGLILVLCAGIVLANRNRNRFTER